MGFKAPRTIYNLNFSGTEYDGLMVSVKGFTTGELFEFKGVSPLGNVDTPVGSASVGLEVLKKFSECLISWNLEEEDGTPIPTTLEAIREQEPAFVLKLVNTWTEVVLSVSKSLGKDSNSGQQFPEHMIPMDLG